MRHLLLLIALLTPLAACGQLPKPFQPVERDNVIASLTRQATIHVLPTRAGDDRTIQPDENLMAKATVQALNNQGLLSTVNAPAGPSRRLVSTARVVERAGLIDRLAVDWTLYEYEGTILGQFTQDVSVEALGWRAGNPGTYQQIAEAAAPTIASFLTREAPEESKIPGRPGANLVVLPVQGGDAEGSEALTRAIIRQLKLASYPVAPEAGDKDLLIAGSIAIEKRENSTDIVTLIWRVLDSSGAELGVVEQANQVARGSLESNWNRSASAIAQAAAPGIIDLLNQAARQGS